MKKKKILLALLASLCVAASATAFAACNDSGTAPDTALYAAYQAYAQTLDNPLPYEEWVTDILEQLANGVEGPQGEHGEDGVGIKDVNIIEKDGKQYFQFVFTDDTTKDVLING